MSIVLYKKQDPSRTKPFEALYIAFFLLSLLTINTYYLVFFEVHYRYILWAFLAVGYMISIFANVNQRTYIDLLINLLAFAFSVFYFRQILDNINNFGSILGQLLAVLLVLRSFVLFNREDFFISLVVSLVIMLLCSIPSYESNYVISLQVYFFVLVTCLYLLSKAREMDEVRLGFYEVEKVRKGFKMNTEAKMLFSLGFISLMLVTAVYLLIPHQQSSGRGNSSQLRKLFGNENPFEKPLEDPNQTDQLGSGSRESETYVGFNEDSFKIASGKTIREGENANDVVMQVQMDYPRYMRAMVWDIYQNGEWKRSGELEDDWPADEKVVEDDDYVRQKGHLYGLKKPREITVEELIQNRIEYEGRVSLMKGYNSTSFLFLPWETTRITINSEKIHTNESSEVKLKTASGNTPTRIGSYIFSAKSYFPSGMEATYLSQRSSGHFLERYTQLPESVSAPINGRTVKEFTEKIVKKANAATDYEKTLAIFKYLKSVGIYSNDVPAVEPGRDLISYFILEVQPMRGHCEIFSSSMALMLRSLDIPCRIATGYSPGNYAFNKNSYVIREKHAHAWVEVFFPEIGWLEFDPTPNTFWNDARDTTGEMVAAVSNVINELYVYSPDQFYRNRILPFTRKSISWYNYKSGQIIDAVNRLVNVQAIYNMILIIVICAALLAIILTVRKPRDSSIFYKRVSRVYYSQFTDTLRKKGQNIAVGETPSDVFKLVSENYPDAAPTIQDFLTDFWILNFAPRDKHRASIKRIKRNFKKAVDSIRKSN